MLATPTGVCVYSSVTGLSIRVNWMPVAGASSYNVYRSEVPHDAFSQIAASIPGITYFDDPKMLRTMNARNLWYYKVSAFDGMTEWSLSSPSTFFPYGQLIYANTPRTGLSYWSLLF